MVHSLVADVLHRPQIKVHPAFVDYVCAPLNLFFCGWQVRWNIPEWTLSTWFICKPIVNFNSLPFCYCDLSLCCLGCVSGQIDVPTQREYSNAYTNYHIR